MSERYDDGIVRMLHGDCLDEMKALPDASIDAVVTDPPYGLAFMGKAWDHGAPGIPFWEEMLRVAKPGAHLLAFGGTRTVHRIATAIEDAGWEIRDMLVWGYASGFPKSLDVSKAIDKAAGADPIDLGQSPNWRESKRDREKDGGMEVRGENAGRITAPATPEAQAWAGWGTALKPAWEPIVLARKPLAGTVASNVLAHGTGALNIDATRIPVGEGEGDPSAQRKAYGYSEAAKKALGATVAAESASGFSGEVIGSDSSAGRWPANIVLTDPIFDGDYPDEVVGGGSSESGFMAAGQQRIATQGGGGYHGDFPDEATEHDTYADAGGKSRFFQIPRGAITSNSNVSSGLPDPHPWAFLVPKESRAMRERGLEGMPEGMVAGRARADGRQWDIPGSTLANGKRKRANDHPTVKPLELMRHLVRLVTPRGGLVLDPFLGSGTTALACSEEGMRCIGIEQDAHYLDVAEGRLQATGIGLGLDVA
jgi:site-specific DNA-methyltransferase (adenine-specific)